MSEIRTDEFEGRPDLVKKRARTIILQRVALAVLAVYVVASLTILVLNALASFQTRDALLDCTQPTGECAREGQEQTAKIIQQLIDANRLNEVATRQIVVLAAACADQVGVDDVEEIQNCVDTALKAAKDAAKEDDSNG